MQATATLRVIATTARLLRSQWWPQEKIEHYQRTRLLSLLKYAVERVPYYASLGLRAADLKAAADLGRFPTLHKADVQEQGARLISAEFDPARLKLSKTSGTTGEPTTTYFSDESWWLGKHALKARRTLSDMRFRRQRVMLLSEERVAEQAWRFAKGLGLVALEYLSLTDSVEESVRKIVEFKPTMIYGFPSYLLRLSESAERAGLRLPSVELIYTSSELLSGAAHATLAAAYDARVVDIYGSTEFKEIAVQCAHGRYHVNFEHVYVESVQLESSPFPRLLFTTLSNRAMPLIRYELGDIGKVATGPCPCGRAGPHITGLEGRLMEVLTFPDGSAVSSFVLHTPIEEFPAIKRFRIVHEQPWALRLEIFAAPVLSAQEHERLQAGVRALLPSAVSLRVVDLVTRELGKKPRAVVREF